MRFTRKIPIDLKTLDGQKRVRRKFLILPRTFRMCGDSHETRWLCFANIIEKVCPYARWHGPFRLDDGYFWKEIGFAEDGGVE